MTACEEKSFRNKALLSFLSSSLLPLHLLGHKMAKESSPAFVLSFDENSDEAF